jgi:hypothetical protein
VFWWLWFRGSCGACLEIRGFLRTGFTGFRLFGGLLTRLKGPVIAFLSWRRLHILDIDGLDNDSLSEDI